MAGATLDGRFITLDKFASQVVLLDFWSSFCRPCWRELRYLLEAYRKFHPRGFEIIGVCLDPPDMSEAVLEFVRQKKIPWPQVYDGLGFDSPIAQAYKVGGVPFTILVGRDGRIAAVNLLAGNVGRREERHWEKPDPAIKRALEQQVPLYPEQQELGR